MSAFSNLVITGMGVPPYSARGLTQTLEPIQQSVSQRRTVNGALVDISASQFQKYRSTITCTDQQVPAIQEVNPGSTVTVKCAAELSYPTSGGSALKSVVAGSSRTDGAWTFYRPELTMMVVTFKTDNNEFGAAVGWTLELEEV